jgi:hypothetical protein
MLNAAIAEAFGNEMLRIRPDKRLARSVSEGRVVAIPSENRLLHGAAVRI